MNKRQITEKFVKLGQGKGTGLDVQDLRAEYKERVPHHESIPTCAMALDCDVRPLTPQAILNSAFQEGLKNLFHEEPSIIVITSVDMEPMLTFGMATMSAIYFDETQLDTDVSSLNMVVVKGDGVTCFVLGFKQALDQTGVLDYMHELETVYPEVAERIHGGN